MTNLDREAILAEINSKLASDLQISRERVESGLRVKLTDKQWEIVYSEITEKDDDELAWVVISDVVRNIEDYEAEYSWWAEQRSKTEEG